MPADVPAPDPRVDYRLAPGFAARLAGAGLVAVALLVVLLALLAALLGWPADVVVAVAVVGSVATLGGAAWLRSRAYVVRLDELGYHVRFVRGAGVACGRWTEVQSAVAASPRGVPCVLLRRTDGSSTSIPVAALAVDRDRFAEAVRDRLRAATGRT